ncbi:MAG: hypothetical protein ACRDP9_26270 [Kribbellaceae bacterium]
MTRQSASQRVAERRREIVGVLPYGEVAGRVIEPRQGMGRRGAQLLAVVPADGT